MIKRKLRAVGANIFAGGFTLGVRKHFEVLAHLEHDDRYGAEVAEKNLGVKVYAPARDAPTLSAWPSFKNVDFVYSNPPCAVWSTIGGNAQSGRDWRDDPRLQRIRDIFALIERERPRAWCWESVCPAFIKGREFVDELVASATTLGYSSTFVFIDARWHGLAQTRKRFFLVCHDVEIEWRAPSFVDGKSAFDVIRGENAKTMGDVSPKLNSIFHKVIKGSRPGEPLAKSYERLFGDDYPRNDRGQAKGRFARSARRLALTGPSGAVVSPWLWHPKEHRQLSVEEFKALCGFPRSFKFPEKMKHDPCVRFLARGVMPPVGEWLAANVAAAIRRGKKIKAPQTWYADFRAPPGRVELAATYEAPSAKRERATRVPGAPKAPRVKTPPIDYDRLDAPRADRAAPRDRSGEYIKHHLKLGRYSYEEIAAMVRRDFDGRTTTVADVYYQRNKLKQNGVVVPERVRRQIKYRETA